MQNLEYHNVRFIPKFRNVIRSMKFTGSIDYAALTLFWDPTGFLIA